MSEQIDVEIFIQPRDSRSALYDVQLRVQRPDELTYDAPIARTVTLDPGVLVGLEETPAEYGRTLFDLLFPQQPDASMRQAFEAAFEAARRSDVGVRLRLMLDDPELHRLQWETLRTATGRWLLSDERVYFSRFLAASEGYSLKAARMGRASALVAIASPDLAKYPQLKPVALPAELERAQTALATIPASYLAGPGTGGRATRDLLFDALGRGLDVLYLVAHGGRSPQGPIVWLEKDDGTAHVVSGYEIAERVRDLARPPRLVVLSSCQSGGEGRTLATNDDGALAALGPLLVRAGVPAVLAMQGNIEMATMDRFMPRFFQELLASRCPDRAVAAARSLVRDADDAHQPVLFSRLRDGRLWYEPGFADGSGVAWGDLVSAIRKGECLPVIGPGLLDPLLGDAAEMARRWAQDVAFPRSGAPRLAEIAQYIATAESPTYLIELLCRDWQGEALRVGKPLLEEAVARAFADAGRTLDAAELSTLVSAIGERLRAPDEDNAYRLLARMPVPIFISATPDNLLADAIAATPPKTPDVEVLCWNEREPRWPSRFDENGYKPTVDRPLVYHVFGHFSRPTSLVLTEDDHFDYLMHCGSASVPGVIRKAFVASPLLFLGFQVDDWRFRVLYRSIVNEERTSRARGYGRRSVAVQLEPDQNVSDAKRLRRTLDSYFREARVQTYWGSAQDFASELYSQLKLRGHGG